MNVCSWCCYEYGQDVTTMRRDDPISMGGSLPPLGLLMFPMLHCSKEAKILTGRRPLGNLKVVALLYPDSIKQAGKLKQQPID